MNKEVFADIDRQKGLLDRDGQLRRDAVSAFMSKYPGTNVA